MSGKRDIASSDDSRVARTAALKAPDFHRALLENMREGVSLATEDGVIVYTNPAEDHMFGYEPGELVGRHVSVQNAYPLVSQVMADLKANGFWRGEWHNRRKDGTAFLTTSRITSIDVDGDPHWLCVQEDITEAPETVQLLPVPDYEYNYVYVNGQPVLVEPQSRRIVYVVR